MAILTKAQKAKLENLENTIKEQLETISGLEQDASNYKAENGSNLKSIETLKLQLANESAKIESNNKLFMEEISALQEKLDSFKANTVESEESNVRKLSVFVNAH